MPRSKKSSRTVLSAQKTSLECFELRLKGLSLREIAKRLNITHEGVRKALERYWDDQDEELRSEARKAALTDLARLDKMLVAWFPPATDEKDPDPAAADKVLKIMERRAKYFGLDGQKLNISGELKYGLPIEFVDRLREIEERKKLEDQSASRSQGQSIDNRISDEPMQVTFKINGEPRDKL